MEMAVTIDPRYHDAVLFDVDGAVTGGGSSIPLLRRLQQVGVATAAYSSGRDCERVLTVAGIADLFGVCVDGRDTDENGPAVEADPAVLLEASRRLGVDPGRSVVIGYAGPGVRAGRSGGFAVVIGVDRTGHADELLSSGADVVVSDIADVGVRTGDRRMSELPNALESYGQLIDDVAGRRLFVCLDYDGTLSAIVSDPDTATLIPGAAEALERLAAQCPVAVLSGRDLADIRDRVGLPGLWYAGSHGFELVGPDGSRDQNDAAASAVRVLEAAAADLSHELEHLPGVRVEHKRFAVAIHYRNVAPEHVAEVVAAAHRCGQRRGLRVTNGRKVVELRPNVDWDKGTALRWIRDRVYRSGDVASIYIGDDLTDEDAFDAIRSDGIGIVVRHDEDGGRPTAARYTLSDPAQVAEMLRRLADYP